MNTQNSPISVCVNSLPEPNVDCPGACGERVVDRDLLLSTLKAVVSGGSKLSAQSDW